MYLSLCAFQMSVSQKQAGKAQICCVQGPGSVCDWRSTQADLGIPSMISVCYSIRKRAMSGLAGGHGDLSGKNGCRPVGGQVSV